MDKEKNQAVKSNQPMPYQHRHGNINGSINKNYPICKTENKKEYMNKNEDSLRDM